MPNTAKKILAAHRPVVRARFNGLKRRPGPAVKPPPSPSRALLLGYRLGLRDGYGEGLEAGVGLGFDAGAKALTLNGQPWPRSVGSA